MGKGNIIFKKATLKNLAEFLFLEKTVIGSRTYSGIDNEKDAIKEIKNNQVYFLEKNGKVIGSVEYKEKSAGNFYIGGLIIHPDWQGKGFGRLAMEYVLGLIKKFKKISLVTHPENSAAVRLYLSLGFVIRGWSDNHYGDGEPRLILEKIN